MWQLDLDYYFFPEVEVKARKEHMGSAKQGKRRKPVVELETNYALTRERKNLAVTVTIHSVDLTDEDPYEFRVQVFGSFSLYHALDEEELDDQFDEMEKLLVRNCVQILIGSLRDNVSGITAKSAYGPLFFDTIYLGLEDIPDPDGNDE